MSGYLIDTSVFVAAEQGRAVGPAPPADSEARISVASVTELVLGVRSASEGSVRALREATLEKARAFIPLPYDEAVAERLADLVALLRSRGRRVNLMDAIIAATALTHELAVWSLDGDFETLAELEPTLRLWPPVEGASV